MVIAFFADVGQLWDIHKYNQTVSEQDAIKMGSAVLLTISEPVTNKTWMAGISDLLKFLTAPDRTNLKKYGYKQLEKLFPGHTGIEWYHKTFTHSNIPDMNEWSDVYMKKFAPKEQEHIRHSVYGSKVERQPDFALLIKTGKPTDPVMAEMHNIQLNIKKPDKDIKGREMTPKQYARFNDLIAEFDLKGILQGVIDMPQYQAIQSNEKRGEILRKIVTQIRKAAKGKLMMEDSTITDNMRTDAVNDAQNILGATATNNAMKALYHRLKLSKEIN
jgi:hypothetical protein